MKTGTSKHLTQAQRAELKSLAARRDDEIDTSDAPELPDWSGAKRGVFTAERKPRAKFAEK